MTQSNIQIDETVMSLIDFNSYPIQPTTTIDLSTFSTTSSKIRYLDSIGTKRTEIAKILNIRYQHVRNTLEYQPKK